MPEPMHRADATAAYQASGQFDDDALEAFIAQRPVPDYLLIAARHHYRQTDAYRTVIDDAVDGAGRAWERTPKGADQ